MTVIFTPKPFAEIVAGMAERVRTSTDRITDFNVGSVVRSLLEAGAVELDDYYQEMYGGLLHAIPTAIYLGFGFDLRPAVSASGTAVFTRIGNTDQALLIPAGTRLQSLAGNYYVTDALVTIAVGATQASVIVTAEVVGAAGNADPGALSLASTEIGGNVLSATNPAILSAGEDAETQEHRAERFAAFIRALARGTPAAMEYAATLPALYHPITGVLSERVQRAAIAETPGYVELFIHNGSYGASEDLIAAVQRLIDGYHDTDLDAWVGGYRPAGMRVDVLPMTDLAFDLEIELTALPMAVQETVENNLSAALARWMLARLPGELVRPIDIINVALGIDGVAEALILAPTSTHTVAANTILYLRTLEVTWAV